MRPSLVILSLVAPLVLVGCIGGSSQETQVATVDDRGFDPGRMEVEVGDEVAWQNEDDRSHTVTILAQNASSNGTREEVVFDRPVDPGQGVVVTFESTGDHLVYSKTHGEPGQDDDKRMLVNVTPLEGGSTYDPAGDQAR